MAKEIIMPKFGFTQEESEILEWLKQNGDKVEKNDPIAVVSTDKISMEVEAPETGILDGIRYKVGDVVPVTKIIAYILQPGESLPAATEEIPAGAKTEPKAKEVKEAKKQVEIPSTVSVSPVAQRMIEDNQLDASQIKGSGKDGQITKKDVEDYLAAPSAASGKVKATPAARRIAKEKQLDLKKISGSGPGGRIQAADVEAARQPVQAAPAAVSTAVPAAAYAPLPVSAGLKVSREIPLVGMRRTIAQNMQRSVQEAPHIVLQADIEMDAAEGLRRLTNENNTDKAKKISVTAVLVKAVAWALKQNPIVNSQFAGDKIVLFSDINVGVATALDNGLIVPVIHHADTKDLNEISQEVTSLAQKARESKLQANDLTDGTFTISNLGMFGIDRFSAIINPPQSAILAVGRMNRVFVPDEQDQPVVRSVITFSLSADHRVMDGVQASKFLTDLNDCLQNLGKILK